MTLHRTDPTSPAVEIERKFLVASDEWRDLATAQVHLVDGLIAEAEGRKVRVRLFGSRATLTIKGKRDGFKRDEFEYEIPCDDAMRLLEQHCGDRRIEKTRFLVPDGDLVWEVDLYEGVMAGIIIAEVELPRLDFTLTLPAWVGEEVTGREEFRKINMLMRRLSAAGRST